MLKPFVPFEVFRAQHPDWTHSSRVVHDHFGRRRYEAQVLPIQMTFGYAVVGAATAMQTAEVTNMGTMPLPIKEIRSAGDFVVTHNCPTTLAPGASCEITAHFLPARPGAATGGIYVDTGDAAGTEFVQLIAAGISAGKGAAGLSVSSLDFGSVNVDSNSAYKPVILANLGDEDLAITSITVNGEFSVTSGAPVTLAPGEQTTFNVRMSPISAGGKAGTVTINHDGTGPKTMSVIGLGVIAGVLPVISISAGVLEPYLDAAYVTANRTSMTFPLTVVGEESDPIVVQLTNEGFLGAAITAAAATGDFELVGVAPTTVPANGGIALFSVKYTPTSVGPANGNLLITTDAATGSSFSIPLVGSASAADTSLPRLKILGNQLLSVVDDSAVRLKSVNWFGAEGENYTPHGTWVRPWRAIIDDIVSMGFNCIRMPFSGSFTAVGRTPPPSALDADANPDLVGKTSLEILDMILDYCVLSGVYVVLDHHRRVAGQGADGSPVGSGYTASNWQASWAVMANRYKDHAAVVGADLHNEPHDLTWDAWATLAEACGDSILSLAPNWLIFVEGVGVNSDSTSYWWGGALKDVATRPVELSLANKVVYSPHEYGQSVGAQTWLATDSGTPPAGWPNNLYDVWHDNWGFIFEENIAPIWIGEFGGHFGVDGNGAVTKPNAVSETAWVTNLVKYLNGDFNGDGTNDLTAGKLGMSFAFWSYNPNSGDTGGLVYDNWVTHQTVKLNLIDPLFS